MKTFATLITDYASLFHSQKDKASSEGNIVGSPLGSWLLLAMTSSSLDFSHTAAERKEIETALGTTVEHAAQLSAEVLVEDRLNYTSHAWANPHLTHKYPGVIKWLRSNTAVPSENLMPPQHELDAWVDENTHGLIKKFPIEASGADEFVFLIANILYMKVEWKQPFRIIEDAVMANSWSEKQFLSSHLHSIKFFEYDNEQYLTYDVESKTGEIVTLVTPYNETSPDEAKTLEAAYHIKVMQDAVHVSHETVIPKENLFTVEHTQGTEPVVEYGYVPAWEASSQHDLYDNPQHGYQAVARTLAHDCDPNEDWNAAAAQSAVAKFKADGFEAAAVTAFGLTRAGVFFPPQQEQIKYTARFSQPFAFICTLDEVPVFSGFIREASSLMR